mmetsp:Transcript_27678/g.63976  ORF Transcript_27678/g.63976 Transcript_27678/m.63976 type:complete len:665 (-) Transcript_27678:327-2321(-)
MSQGSTARSGPMHTAVAQYAEKDSSGQPTDSIRITSIAQILKDADQQQSYVDEREARKREAERQQEVEELSKKLSSRHGTFSANELAELLGSRDCPVAPTTRATILRNGTQMGRQASQRSGPASPPSSPSGAPPPPSPSSVPPPPPSERQRSRISSNTDGRAADTGGAPSRANPSVRFPNAPEVQEYPMQSMDSYQHGKTAPAHLVDTQEEIRRGNARAAGYPASPEERVGSQRSAASKFGSPQTEHGSAPSMRGATSSYARAEQGKADTTSRRDDEPTGGCGAGDRASQQGRHATSTRAPGGASDERGASQRQVTPTRATATGEHRSTTPTRASGRLGEPLATAAAVPDSRAERGASQRQVTPTRASGREGGPLATAAAVPDSRVERGASQRQVTPTRATATGEHRSTTPVRASGREREGEPLGQAPADAERATTRPGCAPHGEHASQTGGRSTMRHTMNTQMAIEEFERQQREKAEQEEVEAAHRREVARLMKQQELNVEFEQEKRRMDEEAKRRIEEKQQEHLRELQRVEEEARKKDEDRKLEREKKDLAHFEAEQQKRRAQKKKEEEEKRKRCEAAKNLIDQAVALYARQKQALLELRAISEECGKLLPQMEEVDLKAKGGKVLYHSFLRLRDATKPAESVSRVDEEIDHLNQLRDCDDF